MSFPIKDRVTFLFLTFLLVVAWLYWGGLSGPFLLDDLSNLNPAFLGEVSWSGLLDVTSKNTSGVLGRPISVGSFTVTGWLHGWSPWGYKYHNLLLHILNGVLLFYLLGRLLERMKSIAPHMAWGLAALSVSVWLIHPLQVSTVLYAVQRMTILSATFTILTVLGYVLVRLGGRKPARKILYYCFLFPVGVMMASLSKETGALIPLYILLVEGVFFKFKSLESESIKIDRVFWVAGIVLPLALGSLYFVSHLDELVDYNLRLFTLLERLFTQTQVIWFYVQLIVFPKLSHLSLYHDDFPLKSAADFWVVIAVFGVLLAFFLAYICRKNCPLMSFGILWFFIGHLMESTVFPLEMVFEHRNYLPALGIILPICYFVLQVKWLKILGCGCFVLLMALCFVRVGAWGDEGILYAVAVHDKPSSFRAQINIADYYWEHEAYEQALRHLKIASELAPEDVGPILYQVRMVCALQGNVEKKLLEEAEHRAGTYPLTPYGLSSLGVTVMFTANNSCQSLKMEWVRNLVSRAIANKITSQSKTRLGHLYSMLAMAEFHSGNYEISLEAFDKAYQFGGKTEAVIEKAYMLLKLKDFDRFNETLLLLKEIQERSYTESSHPVERLEQKHQSMINDNIESLGI